MFGRRMDQDKILSFTKQLYFLLSSGVPLFRGVQIIGAQSPDIRDILKNMSNNLSEGKSFTECISQYPDFSPFYVNMVAVGESRGALEEALKRIYAYLESRKQLREKIIQALTYPIILAISGLVILTMMILFVLPRFAEIFETANIPLPLPTRILLGVHRVLVTQYGWVILGLVLIVVGLIFIRRQTRTREYFDQAILKIPAVGNLLMAISVARLCRTLGILYNSGVQLLPALELSSVALTNKYLQARMQTVVKRVRDGQGISRPLLDLKEFPPMMTQMIAVGEESGSLEKVLLDIAEFYEQEVEFSIKRLMSLLEPLALMIISLFVTLIASSVMLPLFRMSSVMRVM
jgi:type II secretory pathway component PulF